MKPLLRVLGDGGGAGAQAPALGVAEASQGGDQKSCETAGRGEQTSDVPAALGLVVL